MNIYTCDGDQQQCQWSWQTSCSDQRPKETDENYIWTAGKNHLDLLKCESTASPLLNVVLVGWAGDHWPQLSDGARSNLREMFEIQCVGQTISSFETY